MPGMSRYNPDSKTTLTVLYCGECMRRFSGSDANKQLESHVYDTPCPGYADAREIRERLKRMESEQDMFFEALSHMPTLSEVYAETAVLLGLEVSDERD